METSKIMMNNKISAVMILGILLLGCSNPTPVETEPPTEASPAITEDNRGQMLPIGAIAIMGAEEIQLEVARTPYEQAMGLMFRTNLPKSRGMLFIFEPPQPTQFWMKNTLIPLDMVFLRNGEIQEIIPNVPPCTSDPCPSYGPNNDILIDMVIELPAGRAEELGLRVRDAVNLKFLEN